MTSSPKKDLVLVTGGSGHLGAFCVLALLRTGRYAVRTTVRTASRIQDAKAKYQHGGATDAQIAAIDFVTLDLNNDTDEAWTAACVGVKYVFHVAGLIATGKEKTEDDLLPFLKNGTLRVLRAAKTAGVKRVVFTSSVASIAHGLGSKRNYTQPFTEEDWTDLSGQAEKVHIYVRSKTLQEKAAWEFINSQEGSDEEKMEMVVINATAMYGPTLSKEFASSLKLIAILMGGMPGVPQYGTSMVDARDVADLHVLATESEKANGQRYLAITGTEEEVNSESAVCNFVTVMRSAEILREELPKEKTGKIPTRTLPNFVMRAAGYFDPVVSVCLPDLGKELAGSFRKARDELGWKPRPVDVALLDSARSMMDFGVV
ncbi:putative oxidoreductase [Cercospora beticola]|uniref:Putative oxidoreductase n=1 Tax=Cercospora beticola TaxID=122368 RepID=A0A2G5HID8_CERBT|nr:putative oxidoreductase [Cercospora beticola]PIA92275.1 putative oxidoreductase [Cercospora beticola]WPB06354.1 hypothetical protein RHO25_011011 [Cercospora beticola]